MRSDVSITAVMACPVKGLAVPPIYEKFRASVRESGLLIEGRLESAGAGQRGDFENYRNILIQRLWPLEGALNGYLGHPSKMAR